MRGSAGVNGCLKLPWACNAWVCCVDIALGCMQQAPALAVLRRASEWRKVVASQEDPRDLLLGHLEDTAQVKAAATAAGLQVNKHS